MRFTFIVLAITFLALLTGCASSSSAYKESFSEVRISSDLKKALVVGNGKYNCELDIPAPLSSAMNSSLKEGISLLFPNDGAMAFYVNKDGAIIGHFSVILSDSFFQDHEDLKQVAKNIGFSHGQIYSLKGRTEVVQDGKPIPRYAGWSDTNAKKYTKNLGGVFYLPLSITGRRLFNKIPETMQGAGYQKLDQRYTVVVVDTVDTRATKVGLLGPAAVILGGGACIAAWQICLAASLPMMGLKP
ncbi:MAG: hypothetical protein LBH14_01270 [Desulfobulbaceae bacterium]|jgi:hypothetical protein|nr:hypothetical protein [Desulfobulbaceae bacterium]